MEINDRFELTSEKKVNPLGIELFRIRVKKQFTNKLAGEIKEGAIGGWVDNLNRIGGNAWVSGDARVYGNARVSGDAEVSGNAWVSGDAEVSGKCKIQITLCSRFSFEFQWQIDNWLKLEKQFQEAKESIR